MTYMLRNRPLTRQALGRAAGRGTVHGVAMGGVSDIVNGIKFELGIPSDELACLKTANASARVTEIDGRIDDLARNWKPTGFYTPADVTKIYNEVTENIAKAHAALNTAMASSTSDGVRQVNQARAYLNRATERGAVYPTVIAEAQAKGIAVLDSPGLKTWVLQSLVNVSQAYTTVEVLACQTSWLDYAAAAISKAWAVIKKIAGVVVKIGETVLKVADDLPQIWTVVKWGGLAAIAVAVALKLKKLHDAR